MKITFDLIAHIERHKEWADKTFPTQTYEGVLDHMGRELLEIKENPDDISEWVDMIKLAISGALRKGFTPEQIAFGLHEKQIKNENRKWPDWRTVDTNKAIEHLKEVE